MFARTYDSVQEVQAFTPPVYEKKGEQINDIMNMLRKSFLTKNMDAFELKIIADAMFEKTFTKGETIIKYGD